MAYIVTRTSTLKDGRINNMTMLDTEQGSAVDLVKLSDKNFGDARKPTWSEVARANDILEKRKQAFIGTQEDQYAEELKAKQNELEVEKGHRLRAELEIKKLQKTLVEAHASAMAAEASLKFLDLRGSDIIERALSDYIQIQFDLDEYEEYAKAKNAYLVMTGKDWATQEMTNQNELDKQTIKDLLLELDKERVFDQAEMLNFFVDALRKRGFTVNL